MQGQCPGCDMVSSGRHLSSHMRRCESLAALSRSNPAMAMRDPVKVYLEAQAAAAVSSPVPEGDPLHPPKSRRRSSSAPSERVPGPVHVETWRREPTLLEDSST